LAISKEKQTQELQKWKLESSSFIRNEMLEQSRSIKLSEDNRAKREPGQSNSSKSDNEKQRLFNLQITEELGRIRKVVDEKGEILKDLSATQENQSDNFDQLHSDMCNFDKKIKALDMDLSKRIEAIVEVKISNRRSQQQLANPVPALSSFEAAINEKFRDFERSSLLLMDAKVREISASFNNEIAKVRKINGQLQPSEVSQFRKDLTRIEDIANQALSQIQTLSRRYYYSTKEDSTGLSTGIDQPSPTKRISFSTSDIGAGSVNQRTSMYNSNAASRSQEPQDLDPYTKETSHRPRENYAADTFKTPTPPAAGVAPPRKNRHSGIIASGHVREALKSFEEANADVSPSSKRTFLISKR
jgi:hypothetical protein